jgi:hypothetical protein
VSDLAGFLLARIAEDEQAARASLAWASETPDQRWSADDGALLDGRSDTMASYVGDDVAPHIARWDPARVLAECDAKRRVVEDNWAEWEGVYGAPNYCSSKIDEIFRLLALPYADHPDYQQEWKP